MSINAMDKYIFKNYRTRRFSQKTYEGQSNYYIVADVYLESKPNIIQDVVVFWGTGDEDIVRKSEKLSKPLPKNFYKPFYGEFVYVPSDIPLLRFYTKDDVYRGLCKENEVGNFVRNPDGSIREFDRIRVFCRINPAYIKLLNIIKEENWPKIPVNKYLSMWDPKYRALHTKRYCYLENQRIV